MEDSIVVLVVEDDLMIRLSAEEALAEGGYKVEVAPSAEEAIRLLDARDAEYRALVTDVNLGPGRQTGWDVARRAREVSPATAVVYMTGDSAAAWASRGVPNSMLLTKPFVPAQLVTAVSQLLNANPPPAETASR